jgi:NTE family protein
MATFDMVFEGGGAKGVALSGAVSALLARGHSLGRLVGTSAGAITATNLAVGYTPEEILEGSTARTPSGAPIYTSFSDTPVLTEQELEKSGLFHVLRHDLLPLPGRLGDKLDLAVTRAATHLPLVPSLLLLAEEGGMHRGDGFVTWMRDCLEVRGSGLGGATFAELHAHTGKDLSVVATDTTGRRMLVLNHRTAPSLPVVWGVRMSMSIPFYWTEMIWDAAWGRYLGQDISGHVVVDGGVVSNFPLFLLTDPDDDEVIRFMGRAQAPRNRAIGLYLDATLPVPGATPPAPEHPLNCRISALLDTLMAARDNTTFDAHEADVIRLPVAGYGTTEFDMDGPRVRALYDGAAAAASLWLDKNHL